MLVMLRVIFSIKTEVIFIKICFLRYVVFKFKIVYFEKFREGIDRQRYQFQIC